MCCCRRSRKKPPEGAGCEWQEEPRAATVAAHAKALLHQPNLGQESAQNAVEYSGHNYLDLVRIGGAAVDVQKGWWAAPCQRVVSGLRRGFHLREMGVEFALTTLLVQRSELVDHVLTCELERVYTRELRRGVSAPTCHWKTKMNSVHLGSTSREGAPKAFLGRDRSCLACTTREQRTRDVSCEDVGGSRASLRTTKRRRSFRTTESSK